MISSSSQKEPASMWRTDRFSRTVEGDAVPSRARTAGDRFKTKDTQAKEVPPDHLSLTIEKAIKQQWRLSDKVNSYEKYSDVVSDYLHDVKCIRNAFEDVRSAITNAWELNTEFHCKGEVNVKARDEFLKKHNARLVEEINRHLTSSPAALSAKLEAMPVEFARIQLRDSLEDALHKFAHSVCELLLSLVDRAMVGVVDWPTPTACDICYYRDIIIQENNGKQTVRGEERVVGIRNQDFGYTQTLERRVFEISRGQHIRRHARYDLYLTNATSNPAHDTPVLIPVAVQRFLKSLAPWLREIVRVVDGTELKKRIVAMDAEIEQWNDTKLVEVLVREQACYCPVVTLGHFVLTGWGNEEDVREKTRLSSHKWLWAAVALQFLVIILFGLGVLWLPILSYASAIVAGAGLFIFVESNRRRAVAKQQPSGIMAMVTAGLQWTVFTIGMMSLTGGLLTGELLLDIFGLCCLLMIGLMSCLSLLKR